MALAISCLTEMLDCLPNNFFAITSMLGEIISTEIRPLGESVLMQTLFSALYTKFVEIAEKDAATTTSMTMTTAPTTAIALSKSSICTTLAEAICSIDEDNKHTESIHSLVAKAQNYVAAFEGNDILVAAAAPQKYHARNAAATSSISSLEFTVDTSNNIPDILCGDLLKTVVGKQCVKVNLSLVLDSWFFNLSFICSLFQLLYNYLKFNGEWLLHKLDVGFVEMSEFKSLPGQNIKEEKAGLLQSMFHIGQLPFDQVPIKKNNFISFVYQLKLKFISF